MSKIKIRKRIKKKTEMKVKNLKGTIDSRQEKESKLKKSKRKRRRVKIGRSIY